MSEKTVTVHRGKGIVKGKSPLLKAIVRDRYLYLFLVPILAYYIVFKYGPMYGVIIAFKDFRFADGILGSKWVGFKHFQRLFTSRDFLMILRNTLLLNIYSVVFAFPIPIILAILLNEIRCIFFKKVSQSLFYLPHFISWVVLGGIVVALLSPSTGVINIILSRVFGIKPIYFMASTKWWPVVFILSGIWHDAGWGTIIFLAAITGINTELYEAAVLDGANKFQQIWHVTLPGIRSTIAILLILRMGSMMDVGFEQIFILQNGAVTNVAEVISTYVYRLGIQGMQYSYTTALGLFQSVISMILVLGSNKIIKAMGETGLW
ncbi:MAG: ABC transporter permease subunit [Clostridiales bacterium]|nr:ABC transporter permease subunit [Clostridiales bacterium]